MNTRAPKVQFLPPRPIDGECRTVTGARARSDHVEPIHPQLEHCHADLIELRGHETEDVGSSPTPPSSASQLLVGSSAEERPFLDLRPRIKRRGSGEVVALVSSGLDSIAGDTNKTLAWQELAAMQQESERAA